MPRTSVGAAPAAGGWRAARGRRGHVVVVVNHGVGERAARGHCAARVAVRRLRPAAERAQALARCCRRVFGALHALDRPHAAPLRRQPARARRVDAAADGRKAQQGVARARPFALAHSTVSIRPSGKRAANTAAGVVSYTRTEVVTRRAGPQPDDGVLQPIF